jgi:hypothetical protein
MRARTISFTHEVRTGPTVSDRKNRLRLDDKGFAGGTIDVDITKRVVKLWNPAIDPTTREPVEVGIPIERVVDWEPLSEAQAELFYPKKKPEVAA